MLKMIMKHMWFNVNVVQEQADKKLRWDQLVGFAFLALILWIIVQNSPNAKEAFTAILLSVRTAITNLFNAMGSF